MSLPDPPVPGSIVWRGWLTKKGSFMPTLKRRFGTLHIGGDYAVTLDYRENESSSTSKGFYNFTTSTKCICSSSFSIGSFPPHLCLIVEVDAADCSKLHCCFDSTEDRHSFQAAVEWAVNARSHVAAFQFRQEEAKRIAEEKALNSVQKGKQQFTIQEPGDARLKVQLHTGTRSSAAGTARSHRGTLSAEDQEVFVSRLVLEAAEHRKHLQRAAAFPEWTHSRTHDWPSAAGIRATIELHSQQTPCSELNLQSFVGSKQTKDFVQRIVLEHENHSAQLAVAAKF